MLRWLDAVVGDYCDTKWSDLATKKCIADAMFLNSSWAFCLNYRYDIGQSAIMGFLNFSLMCKAADIRQTNVGQHVFANSVGKQKSVVCSKSWPTFYVGQLVRTCSSFVGQQAANRALWLAGCSKHHGGRMYGCILCWLTFVGRVSAA